MVYWLYYLDTISCVILLDKQLVSHEGGVELHQRRARVLVSMHFDLRYRYNDINPEAHLQRKYSGFLAA